MRTQRRRFPIIVLLHGVWFLAVAFSGNAQLPGTGRPSYGVTARATDAASAKSDNPPQPEAIPLAEIAVQAAHLQLSLRTIADTLPDEGQIAEMEAEVQRSDTDLEAKRKEVDAMLRTDPGSIELRELRNYWESVRLETGSRRKLASAWADSVQKAITRLDALREPWAITLKATRLIPASALSSRWCARACAPSMNNARPRVSASSGWFACRWLPSGTIRPLPNVVLRLSSEQVTKGLPLRRDSTPLWDLEARRGYANSQSAFSWTKVRWRSVLDFVSGYKTALCLLGMLLLFSLWGTLGLRRRFANAVPTGPQQAVALVVLRRWIALGSSIPLLFFCLLMPRAPTALIGLIILIWCFPILRLLPLQVPGSEGLVNRAVAVYAAYAVVAVLAPSPVYSRDLTFAMNCLTLLIFGHLVRPSRIRSEWARHPPLVCQVLVVVAAIGFSTVATLLGYQRLTQFVK